jgi:hypothetical protein
MTIKDTILANEPRRFWRVSDFKDSAENIKTTLDALVASGSLKHVHEDIYWRGVDTRFGMSPPYIGDVALLLGGPGTGPTGYSASNYLSLSTQVPNKLYIASPSPCPTNLSTINFVARPIIRRELQCTYTEVALLEILQDPGYLESSWPDVIKRITTLIHEGYIRNYIISTVVANEAMPGVQKKWSEILQSS